MNQEDIRLGEIKLFIAKYNLEKYQLNALIQDASYRRYFRLNNDKKSFILMDCPPNFDSILPFIKATNFLSKYIFSVPKIYYQNIEKGLLILEDFGSDSFNNYLNKTPQETNFLYKLALENLIKLNKIKSQETFPIHNQEELISGIKLFNKYFLNSNNDEFIRLCSKLFQQLNYQDQYLSLRDFHADNLLYLKNRDNYQKIGLLDYQDISYGFISYDLLSLIQDARKFISFELQQELLNYFLEKIAYKDKAYFLKEYEILSLQRNCRIIGLFNKFAIENNNNNYLKYLDNLFKYLNINLQSNFLKEIKDYLIDNNSKIRDIIS